MANTLITSKINTSALIWSDQSNTITIVGNDSVSQIAVANSGEVVSGASISKVVWGTSGNTDAYWIVNRGINALLYLPGTGKFEFSKMGLSMDQMNDTTIGFQIGGTSNGFILIEVKKHLSNTVIGS